MRRRAALCALLLSPLLARADHFYPMIMAVRPVAVQVGKQCECEFESRYNLAAADRVLVTGSGVTGEVVPPPLPKGPKGPVGPLLRLKVRFKTAADALPGVRDVRIITPRGGSTLGQLVVTRDPVVAEAPNNNTMKTAQPVTLPAAICGAIEAPLDVDFYKFKVAAGTALTFHTLCYRLSDRIHDLQEVPDPILFLRDAKGAVLASNDNYHAADPLLHHKFAAAGEYYLEVRDVRYAGQAEWTYCIEVNDRPFVTSAGPLRVRPGRANKLAVDGFNLPARQATLTLPAGEPEGIRPYPLHLGGGHTTNPVPLVVSNLPEVAEAPGDNNTPAKAQKVPVPCGIAGRMDADGDVDCYAFDAKKGESFTATVYAQRAGSRLDSILRILGPTGQRLVENDDHAERLSSYNSSNQTADSRVEGWVAPADGRYVLQLRDVHQRGGPAFGYFLRLERSRPGFVLDLDSDKTNLAPGTAGVIHARVTRRPGFTGEVQLSVEGLPPGVKATCGRVLATGTDGCIVLTAEPGARKAAANVRVFGTATLPGPGGKPTTLRAEARPLQEFYVGGGGRNHYPVSMHTVTVGEPLDLLGVAVSPTEVTLKPGESKKVEVTVRRRPGFKGPLTLDLVYQHLDFAYNNSLPAGVTIDGAKSQTVITAEQSKGWITLRAAPDAKPVERQLVAVLVHESINFAIKFTFAGGPLAVTVRK